MSEPRSVRLDVAALLLSAIVVFLLVSLITFDPADSIEPVVAPLNYIYTPDILVYPQNTKIQNGCGYAGALVSHLLVQTIGLGAFYLTATLGLLSFRIFARRWSPQPLMRGIGWALTMLALVSIPPLLNLHPSISATVGAGGYLGALSATWINEHFAFAGAMILVGSCLSAGLLMSTDYAILHALQWMVLAGLVGLRLIPRPSWLALFNRESNVEEETIRTDLPETLAPEDPDGPLPVRIRGREFDASAPIESEIRTPTTVGKKAALAMAAAAGLLGAKGTVAEEEVLEEDAEAEEADVRLLEVEGEEVEVRSDSGHTLSGPRIRNRASKKTERDDSLDTLDDTRLPEGTEDYVLPSVELLIEADDVCYEDQAVEVRRKAKILEKTFQDFGFNIRVVEIETGPVIAQYEVELEAGLRLSKITSLADDLAIALRVPSVRIVAPIPGKNTVGIEVPNETRQVVRMREVIEEAGTDTRKMKIPIFLGKDVSGKPLTVDLASMPHLLIAGRTGTGKSVCLNAIISSILMTRRPDEVRMLMIDPKMVELSGYGRLPHLMHPVVTDMRKAEAILAWAVDKMEERYSLLARVGVRHISSYNQLGRDELLERLQPETPDEADLIPDQLPFIVIVADEIADLMMTAGKEVEQHIIRLAQKSRAVGIHLILATQKPTVDVITGLIKSNLPARLAFQVASRTDSRVVLDEMGADKLLGNGDMLFLWPGTSTLLRGQGTYLSDEEINSIVDHCSTGEQNFVHELINLKSPAEEGEGAKPGGFKKRDDLYEAAVDVVVREGRGSVSLLQRTLGIGYGRAARLIDYMAEDGIVGQYNGSQAREVVITISDWEEMRGGSTDSSSTASPDAGKKKNRILRQDGWDEPSKTSTENTAGATANASSQRVASWEDEGEEEEFEEDDE